MKKRIMIKEGKRAFRAVPAIKDSEVDEILASIGVYRMKGRKRRPPRSKSSYGKAPQRGGRREG